MKKNFLSLVSVILLVTWPAQLFAQTVTWGNVSASPAFVSTQGSIVSHYGFFAPSFTSSNGTTSSTWSLSGASGPQLSNNAGVIEARNAALSAFAIVRGATPVASNDLATKAYVDGVGAAITIPSLTGVATSTGCLSFGGGVYAWASCGGGGTSVTGTGFWYNATGTLNGAAVGLSGDATIGAISGGNVPLTLATVNGNVGTFGTASVIPSFTVNAKGLITAVTTNTVAAALGSATGTLTPNHGGTGLTSLTVHGVVIGEGTSNVSSVVLGDAQLLVGQTSADPLAKTMSGDATLADTGALTLATVNATTGSFGTSSSIPVFSVNGKGLITAASTVAVAIAATQVAPGTTGQVLMTNGGTSTWNTLTGDVTISGTGSTTVNSISGSSPITIANAPLVAWAAAVGTPEIRQLQQTSNIATNNLTITPQRPFASATGSNGTPGSLVVNLAAPVSSGSQGFFEVNPLASTGQTYIGVHPSNAAIGMIWTGLGGAAPSSTNFALEAWNAQGTILNGISGNLYFGVNGGGIGQGVAAGWELGNGSAAFGGGTSNMIGLVDSTGVSTSACTGGLCLYSHSGALELNASGLQFTGFQSNPLITQNRAAASANGDELEILGQQGGTGNTNGGDVDVIGGQLTGGGQPGSVVLADGSETYELFVTPVGGNLFGPNWSWLPSVTNPTLGQIGQSSDVATNVLFIQAQNAWSSAVTNQGGGSLLLEAGLGTTGPKGGSLFAIAGDGNTSIELVPGAQSGGGGGVYGNSVFTGGTGATTDQLVAQGQGTVNSQQVFKGRFRAYCRTTSATPVNCGAFTVPLGVAYTFRLIVSARDVSVASANSDLSFEHLGMYANVGGTVSQVGSTNWASTSMVVSGSNTNLSSASFTTSLSSATVTFKAGGIGGTDTFDWVVDGEIVEN